MAYYQTKREYVAAWKNDGNAPPKWVYKYGVQIGLVDNVSCTMVGFVLIYVGDWFVVDKEEECFSMTDEDFNDLYEVAT